MNKQIVRCTAEEVLLSDKPRLPYVFHHHFNKWLKQFMLPNMRLWEYCLRGPTETQLGFQNAYCALLS